MAAVAVDAVAATSSQLATSFSLLLAAWLAPMRQERVARLEHLAHPQRLARQELLAIPRFAVPVVAAAVQATRHPLLERQVATAAHPEAVAVAVVLVAPLRISAVQVARAGTVTAGSSLGKHRLTRQVLRK
jgi:hypothetical protein